MINLSFFMLVWLFFFFKQKTAYEMRISDWSSDVCSSDLAAPRHDLQPLRDQRAVETGQPRDVGDGAQRDEVEQFDQRRFGPRREETARAQVTEQRRAEQEGHPDRGEIAVDRGVGVLVEPVRVHHRSEEHPSELQSLMRISYAVFCLK